MNHPHEGHRERLREKIRKDGLSRLEPHEILEYLLFPFIPRRNTNDIAHALIARFGSLSSVFDADYNALLETDGMTANAALFLTQMPALVVQYKTSKAKQQSYLNPADAAVYLNELIGHQPVECVAALALDAKGGLISTIQFRSSRADAVNLDMRNLVKELLLLRATGVIIAHNHPSGDVTPSEEDIRSYDYIKATLVPLEIALLDCLIVGDGNAYSLLDNAEGSRPAGGAPIGHFIDAGVPAAGEFDLLYNRKTDKK